MDVEGLLPDYGVEIQNGDAEGYLPWMPEVENPRDDDTTINEENNVDDVTITLIVNGGDRRGKEISEMRLRGSINGMGSWEVPHVMEK